MYSTFGLAEYLAIVDAGSSSSRVYFYKAQNNQITDLTPQGLKSVTPAIANLSTDAASVQQYSKNLSDPVLNITDNGHVILPSEINFYVLATAGMRLANPNIAKTLYPLLTQDLLTDGFAKVTVQTIPGKMEGAYDWLALNYLKNTLSGPSQQTVGILDMGGASTEIVFATQKHIPQPSDVLIIKINNMTYQLYSHSYLGLGEDVARSQYMNDANCFPVDYVLPNGSNGVGQYNACLRDTTSLIKKVQHVDLPFLPNTQKFYAISGFYYTGTEKPFGFTDTLTLSTFVEKGQGLCASNWSELQTNYPGDKYLYTACFNSAYFNALLTQGYSFGVRGGDELQLGNSINNTAIDWTLGAALYFSTEQIGKLNVGYP